MAVRALTRLLESSFGPGGRDKMVVARTGPTKSTCHGATLLRSVSVSHPLARVVVDAGLHVDNECGDGSTTTVLLLSHAMQRLEGTPPKCIQRVGYELLRPGGTLDATLRPLATRRNAVRHLLDTQFNPALSIDIRSRMCDLIYELVDDMSDEKKGDLGATLAVLRRNPPIIHATPLPISASLLADGVVIAAPYLDRWASAHLPILSRTRVLVLRCAIAAVAASNATVQVSSARAHLRTTTHAARRVQCFIKQCRRLGIGVVVTTARLNEKTVQECARHGILAVHGAARRDAARLCAALGAHMHSQLDDTLRAGECAGIERVAAGKTPALQFTAETATLILAAPSPAAADELERSVVRGIKGLATWTRRPDSMLSVPGAGAPELALAAALDKMGDSAAMQSAFRALSSAYQAIAVQIAQNLLSPYDSTAQAASLRRRALQLVHQAREKQGLGVCSSALQDSVCVVGDPLKIGVVQPLGLKRAVLTQVVTTLKVLLRVDRVVSVRRISAAPGDHVQPTETDTSSSDSE